MQGRYGNDELNRFLLKILLVAFVLSLVLGRVQIGIFSIGNLCYWIGLFCLIYSYFRMFSRNSYKRSQENNLFLQKKRSIKGFWQGKANIMQQRKTHHIYTCPGCKQKIRVPKGKGKIEFVAQNVVRHL
jgi:hypothetical protein